MPYTDIVEPRREKLLKDKEDPRWIKSNTDMVEPRRVVPYSDSVLPNRTKLLIDIADATVHML
jgi:hypothetical protein